MGSGASSNTLRFRGTASMWRLRRFTLRMVCPDVCAPMQWCTRYRKTPRHTAVLTAYHCLIVANCKKRHFTSLSRQTPSHSTCCARPAALIPTPVTDLITAPPWCRWIGASSIERIPGRDKRRSHALHPERYDHTLTHTHSVIKSELVCRVDHLSHIT